MDFRDSKSVVKNPLFGDHAQLRETSLRDDIIYERNGKYRQASFGKTRQAINVSGRKNLKTNFGPVMKHYPVRAIHADAAQIGQVSKYLKTKSHKQKSLLENLQTALRGVVFETSFVYVSTSKYLRSAGGLVQVYKTPNLGATRLLLLQILRCRSNISNSCLNRLFKT